ncbi:site-specific DNA-methyltransferase [Nocardioides sp. C4-1]|uniref:DNA-methyltransferase n=1 Tax=Nocardioides sp. C4-1 TaxID=3151851 RepID=UPI0032633C27
MNYIQSTAADPEASSDQPSDQPSDHMSIPARPAPAFVRVVQGDAWANLREIRDASVHSVVTDPPYALDSKGQMLGQLSKNYHQRATHSRGYADNSPEVFKAWCADWTAQRLRVLLPGGYLVAFAGAQTIHLLVSACQEAGFQVRDLIVWAHGAGVSNGLNLLDENGKRIGWGTTLRPATEFAVLARCPFEGTVASNVARFGTGAMNLGETHFGSEDRWPSNMLVSDDVAEALGKSGRLFFSPKASRRERPEVDGVSHSTVKPLVLMCELVRLVTPPCGIVLDPFAGSGTTVEAALREGMSVIGIERDAGYLPLIDARVERARRMTDPPD